jgi:hypothetical protein
MRYSRVEIPSATGLHECVSVGEALGCIGGAREEKVAPAYGGSSRCKRARSAPADAGLACANPENWRRVQTSRGSHAGRDDE